MGIAKGEAVEVELVPFIRTRHDRRLAEEGEQLAEEAWMESERRYDEQRRQENRAAWYGWHLDQAERHRRTLEGLIAHHEQHAAGLLTREALGRLSAEDLDGLEDALEAGQRDGTLTFEDLYRVVGERSRRTLGNLFDALEALREGREPRASPQLGEEHINENPRGRDGYRIWKYRK